MAGADPREWLASIFRRVTARIDGERLVAAAANVDPTFARATHVLAVGKAAFPMLRGLPPATGTRRVLAIAPAPLLPAVIPAGVEALGADHPQPGPRSVAAAAAALAFVTELAKLGELGELRGVRGLDAGLPANLLVLLSGGASSLMCAPAGGLAWSDKRDAIDAIARAGASIRELNVVRKHLSAIKGGRLALATRAPIAVRALSDVIGDDAATIGSGPFWYDPSRFAEALAIAERLGVALPAAVREHLEHGARGGLPETPKPDSGVLGHVGYQVLAGPARVLDEARQAAHDEGLAMGALPIASEDAVGDLAEAILSRTRGIADAAGRPRVFIGNGEPRVRLGDPAALEGPAGGGHGGRATHLALLVARGLAALPASIQPGVAFLAAGTDDRDGDTDVSGAIVDATTWDRARALGLDPERALRRFDSLSVLAATGDTIRGPGTSNLLDLFLLVGPWG